MIFRIYTINLLNIEKLKSYSYSISRRAYNTTDILKLKLKLKSQPSISADKKERCLNVIIDLIFIKD